MSLWPFPFHFSSSLQRQGRRVVIAAVVGFACCVQTPSLGSVTDRPHRFALASAPLVEALENFSRVTGLDVVARGDLFAGKTAPALTGEFLPDEALRTILRGTGLRHRFASDRTVVVLPEAEAQGEAAGGATLHEVVVTGLLDHGYQVESGSTATRLEMPLRDVPQAMNVVPRQVLTDRGLLRAEEIADNVPGVQAAKGYGGISSGDFFIRGFSTQSAYRNGFKDFSFLSPVDLAGVERVEFLKGPSSVLYGQGAPGGVVNYIIKTPGAARLRELAVTSGSDGLYRAALDMGGPLLPGAAGLAGEPPLLYRWNTAYEEAASHRDYHESRSLFLAPAVTWNISPSTVLKLMGEYHRYDYVFDRGLQPVAAALRVPVSRYLGEPGTWAETDAWRASYELVHRFNDGPQFRSALAAVQSEQHSLFAQPTSVAPDGRTVLRQATARQEKSVNYTFQNEVSGRFETGGVEHQFLLGAELARYQFDYAIGFEDMASIDYYRPRYGSPVPRPADVPATGYGADTLGIYLQDMITLHPVLKVLAGVRYDRVESRDSYSDTETSDGAWSPRFGVVYQPWEPVSLYLSTAQSFQPNFGAEATGAAFDPEEGQQVEGGVKAALFGGRLDASLAVYEIRRKNVLTPDPSNPEYQVPTGAQRSRGLELDVSGSPHPGWNLTASYAWTDATITSDTVYPRGTRLAAVPEHEAGLWTSYEWQSGPLKGFGLGAGVFYASDRPATLQPDSITLPSYCRWDASLFYRRDRWSAQINLKNLGSARIYQSQGYLVYPDPPFQVQATLTWRF